MLDKTVVKTVRIQFNVTEQDKEFIYTAAKKEKLTISEFIRRSIKFYIDHQEENK